MTEADVARKRPRHRCDAPCSVDAAAGRVAEQEYRRMTNAATNLLPFRPAESAGFMLKSIRRTRRL
ncbi:hypothetical protein KCP73_22345 [Salmonella enterica subsp. enterica]|nr:hypothetical protein KCP73_22345 [Salmonella enterica subsp. enterica]